MRLKGKVAIVTGGATGLGAAVCERLAERGANLIVNYSRSREQAEATAQRCRELGVEAHAVQADVGVDDDCRQLVEQALAHWGRVDILINNAGTTRIVPLADLDGLSDDDFLGIYRTNVIGAYQMARACAPHMKQAGHGAIVNVSSISAQNGLGSSIAYAASKGALNTMTLSLARALAPEIRVNAVSPGFIATRWFSNPLGEEGLQKMIAAQEATTPLRRAGTAEDIATAIVFLADEGAQHITGSNLTSDAGHLLGGSSGIPARS